MVEIALISAHTHSRAPITLDRFTFSWGFFWVKSRILTRLDVGLLCLVPINVGVGKNWEVFLEVSLTCLALSGVKIIGNGCCVIGVAWRPSSVP